MLYILTIVVFLFSNGVYASDSDVHHVFEDGEVIRAGEMNENFSSINSEITTIKTDVENNQIFRLN